MLSDLVASRLYAAGWVWFWWLVLFGGLFVPWWFWYLLRLVVGLGRLGFLGLGFAQRYCDTVSRFEVLLLGLVYYFWVVCDLLPSAFGLLRVVWFRVLACLPLVWVLIASHTHDFGCWCLTCFVW